ncbi:MAG: FAD-dependent oxidoreductase [Anaerolineae bacterium]
MLRRAEQGRSDACDVVVVGAGLVGAAVAARLSREGLDTSILEAGRVSGGATGRSLGVVSLGLTGLYGWAVSVYGRQRAREIWALTAGGRARLVATARRLGIAVRRSASYALAEGDEEVEALRESANLLREDGFEVSFIPSDPLDRGFEAALHSPDDVIVDARALTRALLEAEGIRVHERTEVHALEPIEGGIRVWAHGRTVICSAVVLAVNGYAALAAPYLADKVAPVPYLLLTTRPLDIALPGITFVGGGRAMLRPLPDGRVLLATRQPWTFGTDDESPPDQLLDLLSRRFPEADVRHAICRSEVVGATPDGLPLVGRLPSPRQAYFAVGLGGRGLSWAFVVAERLVGAMLRSGALGLLGVDRLTQRHSSP